MNWFYRLSAMLLALGVAHTATSAPGVGRAQQEVMLRLSEYERRASAAPDPAALSGIARLVMNEVAASPDFAVWSEACTSDFVPDPTTCTARLLSLLKDPKAPAAQRARAGAALVRAGHPAAEPALLGVVEVLSAADLAPLSPFLTGLKEARVMPLLQRLLASSAPAHQAAACRVLATLDSNASREALRTVVDRSPAGLQPWNTCMVARARLKEADAVLKISGFSRYMEGEDLLDTAETMLEIGNQQGDFLLRKVTREASPTVQLMAAERLAKTDSAYAAKIAEPRIQDADPAIRAGALRVERQLRRPPSPQVRRLMTDPAGLVRLRAAEAILDWARE